MARMHVISPPRGSAQTCSVCDEPAILTAEWTNKGPEGLYQSVHLCIAHGIELTDDMILHTQDHGTGGWRWVTS